MDENAMKCVCGGTRHGRRVISFGPSILDPKDGRDEVGGSQSGGGHG